MLWTLGSILSALVYGLWGLCGVPPGHASPVPPTALSSVGRPEWGLSQAARGASVGVRMPHSAACCLGWCAEIGGWIHFCGEEWGGGGGGIRGWCVGYWVVGVPEAFSQG